MQYGRHRKQQTAPLGKTVPFFDRVVKLFREGTQRFNMFPIAVEPLRDRLRLGKHISVEIPRKRQQLVRIGVFIDHPFVQ